MPHTAKIGWDDVERAEFAKALKQPLMVQTPLQVVLETLFARIQAQATLFSDLQRRIERIEARDINGEEMLARIRVCEDSLATVNHQKLSPFNQQEVFQRLDELEIRVTQLAVEGVVAAPQNAQKASESIAPAASLSRRASMRSLQDYKLATAASVLPSQAESRIEALEAKLAGVYNLTGKLMAVEQMAAELGMEVPDLELAPDTEASPRHSDDSSDLEASPSLGTERATSVSFKLSSKDKRDDARGPLPGMPGYKRAGGLLKSKKSDGGNSDGPALLQRSASGMRLAEVLAQVEELRSQTEGMRETLGDVHTELAGVKTQVAEAADGVSLRVAALEAASVEMRENIMTEIASVRKEIHREPEVSYADFSALSDRVEAACTDLATTKATVTELTDTHVAEMKDQITDLKDQFKRIHETRDMDTLFHNRISKLESTVGDIKSEVQLAVQDCLDDVVRLSDVNALEDAIEKCATAADVRQLAAQQASLAQSVSGMADWLAVRPDTADGVKNTGSSATRFKCLTCDREIRTQNGGTPPKDAKAKGTFLPRLEGMPASPGAPVGPGINAGELRRLAEERATGRKGSPARERELEEYGQERTSKSRGSPRRVRSGGRQPLAMTSSSMMPKEAQTAHRTPVFI